MAAGRSVRDMSDEYHEFPCYSCSKEGRNISAIKFCVDCDHLLCSTCLCHHNKFNILKDHRILDKTAVHGSKKDDKPDIPTLRCEKHGGKILDMFCIKHDEPCCVVCASVDHSACTEKDYLPNRAKSDFRNEELQGLRSSAVKIKERLEKTKEKRVKALEDVSDHVSDQKASILDKIAEKRVSLNRKLDDMEHEVMLKLHKKFTEYSNGIIANIENVETFIQEIEECEEKISQPNKSNAFIVMKKLQHSIANGPKYMDKQGRGKRTLELIDNRSFSNVLNSIGLDVFGYISGDGEIESAVEYGEFNIKAQCDSTVSCISDCCLMEDGRVVLADQNNRKLKILDKSFQLKDTLILPGKPCAVCPTRTTEVAVSLLSTKLVQFVCTENGMSLSGSFSVGESCRGIAFHDGLFYLSCGGMFKYKDGPGELRVYDRAGKIISKVDQEVEVPKRICIKTNLESVQLFIADEEKGVLNLNAKPRGIETRNIYKNKKMKDPVGICNAERGQILVSGYDSNNVMLISDSGTNWKELMSEKNGIQRPKGLCLDQTGSKLILGMADVNVVKVMHLIRK